MSTAQKRAAIKNVYRSPNWEERVDRMSDAQVHVIYTKFQEQGKV